MTPSLAIPPTVPCEPFPGIFLEAIARAVVDAWRMVCESGFDSFEDEDETTAALEEALHAIMEEREGAPNVPLFTDRFFETPPRDAKQRNHSRTQHDKMPDLTFRLSGVEGRPRPYRAVFVECKVLDESRGFNLYCKYGVLRFVDGRYAHRMPHAMMLAYVLEESVKHSDLDNYFHTSRGECAKTCEPLATGAAPYSISSEYPIYVTTHQRLIANALGTIDLHHLWLTRVGH